MWRMKLIVLLSVMFFVMVGCAKRQYDVQYADQDAPPADVNEKEETTKSGEMEKPDVPPTPLPTADQSGKVSAIERIEETDVPPSISEPKPSERVWEGEITHTNPPEEETQPVAESTPPPMSQIKGYRVQIMAASSEQTANQAAADVKTVTGKNTYVDYIAPYWKVRVGDCKTRGEADQLKNQLLSKGYTGAWVVECMVNAN